jgi:hypothetical protein
MGGIGRGPQQALHQPQQLLHQQPPPGVVALGVGAAGTASGSSGSSGASRFNYPTSGGMDSSLQTLPVYNHSRE